MSEDDKVKFEKEREERKNVKSDSNESLLSKPLQQEEPKEKIKKSKPKGPSIRERMQESILAKGHKVSLAGPILVGGVLDSRQTLQNCDKHNHSTYDGMMRHNVDTILVHLTPQQGRR